METDRIFIFKTGWCVDLDMIFYIGIPEISDGSATIKIGVYGKEDIEKNYIIHNEPVNKSRIDVSSNYLEYYRSTDIFKKEYEKAKKDDEQHDEDGCMFRDWSCAGLLWSAIGRTADNYADIYIEHEMKMLVDKLRNAWIKRLMHI